MNCLVAFACLFLCFTGCQGSSPIFLRSFKDHTPPQHEVVDFADIDDAEASDLDDGTLDFDDVGSVLDVDDVDGGFMPLHTKNVMQSWDHLLSSLDDSFLAEEGATELFNVCTVDLEVCVRDTLGEHEPVSVFFGTISSESYVRYRKQFAEAAHTMSTFALFAFLVLEFVVEKTEIKQSIESRDSWERVSNRIFEMWWQLSLPQLVASGALISDGDISDCKIKKGDNHASLYQRVNFKRYELKIPIDQLARKLVGVPCHEALEVTVSDKLKTEKKEHLDCEHCTKEKEWSKDEKQNVYCPACRSGLVTIISALGAPIQSRHGDMSIFKILFSWNVFVDTKKLEESNKEGMHMSMRRDAKLLIHNFWSAVADRSALLWRVLRQSFVSLIFFAYLSANLRLDFVALVAISILKLVFFYVGFAYFFDSKPHFESFQRFLTFLHVMECSLISWVYWEEGGIFRSAAVTWRVIQEIEINPMILIVKEFPWWDIRLRSLSTAVQGWFKSLRKQATEIGTCSVTKISDSIDMFDISEGKRKDIETAVRKFLELSIENASQQNKKKFIYVASYPKEHLNNFRVRRVLTHYKDFNASSHVYMLEKVDATFQNFAKTVTSPPSSPTTRCRVGGDSQKAFWSFAFLLANTNYWYNSYTGRTVDNQTELDRGFPTQDDAEKEWENWEGSSWFDELREPFLNPKNVAGKSEKDLSDYIKKAQEADENLEEAKKNKKEADKNRAEADKNRAEADENKKEAEKHKEDAEESKIEAKKHKEDAERKKNEADESNKRFQEERLSKLNTKVENIVLKWRRRRFNVKRLGTITRLSVAERDIDALQAENNALQEKNNALQAENNALQEKNNALQAENNALQEKNIALQAANDAPKAENDVPKTEVVDSAKEG